MLVAVALAEEIPCKGDHCVADQGSTAGTMMLQVVSAKSSTNAADYDEEDTEDMEEQEDDSDVETDLDETEIQELSDLAADEEAVAAEASACGGKGKLVDGKCWYVALPSTSCEETCAEKDLQYDEATDLGKVTKTNTNAQDKCLSLAAQFGFKGRKERLMQWAQGCGCVVYKVPAYGTGDRVRLNHGETNAKCSRTSTISARLCACKAGSAIGASCKSSSGCTGGFCKSGKCAALLPSGGKCSEHDACKTGYCSPSTGKCGILEWKVKKGAYALGSRKSGQKRFKRMKVPNWTEMSKFGDGFCLGYYARTTGCLLARGINRAKTIAKAKQRCAKNEECKAVWCCATACPATTCYATKATEPNLKAKDCPDAPGSFRETKYPNSFYVKDAESSDLSPPKEEEDEEEATKDKEPENEEEAEKEPEKTPEPEKEEGDASDEEEAGERIFKLVKARAVCKFGRGRANKYTRIKGESSVETCAEAVKQREGLSFGWMPNKKLCLMAPKSFDECPSSGMRRGKFDLYNLHYTI